MMHSRKTRSKGFTLIEAMVTLLILGVLVAWAIPAVLDYNKQIKGSSATLMMRNIQIAKEKWLRDYPNHPIIPNVETLEDYMKESLPKCPSGGTWENLLDTRVKVTSSLNGNPAYEPKEYPLESNGFYDLGQLQ